MAGWCGISPGIDARNYKIRPELDRLLAVRLFMDRNLYDRVIAQAKE
jgi:hypothetical protein